MTAGKPAVEAHRGGTDCNNVAEETLKLKGDQELTSRYHMIDARLVFDICKRLQQANRGRFPQRASNRKLPSESTAEERLLLHKHPVK